MNIPPPTDIELEEILPREVENSDVADFLFLELVHTQKIKKIISNIKRNS